MKQAIAAETAKASPPVAAAGYSWFAHLDGSTLVTIATLGYIVLQAAFLIWQWRQKQKQAENGQPI